MNDNGVISSDFDHSVSLSFVSLFTDVIILREIIRNIRKVWNVKTGQGTMHS